MAESIGADIVRDTALEQKMLAAVVADRNEQPRNQQVQVGPSSIGFCRELLRASLFEPQSVSEPETHWATAAHAGSVMGADLERIFGARLGALEQQRIQVTFDRLGLDIEGSSDLIFLDDIQITDLKSVDDIGGVLYDLRKNASLIETLLSILSEGALYQKNIETPDGGYELTEVIVGKISKLHYYVQVAMYVTGAIQAGILPANAGARLVFYDRSGNFQEFVALVVPPEHIALFFQIGQSRVEQVARAQQAYEATNGNPATISHLRDQSPSFCFSPKVMCARRMHCWAGSDWAAENQISGAEIESAVDRYEEGRRLEKLGAGMKAGARGDLKGVQGQLPDGRIVTWVRGGNVINVVSTTLNEPAKPPAPVTLPPPVLRPEVRLGNGEVLTQGDDPSAGVLIVPDELAHLGHGVHFEVDEQATLEGEARIASAPPEIQASVQRTRAMQQQIAADRKARHGG